MIDNPNDPRVIYGKNKDNNDFMITMRKYHNIINNTINMDIVKKLGTADILYARYSESRIAYEIKNGVKYQIYNQELDLYSDVTLILDENFNPLSKIKKCHLDKIPISL